MIAFRSNFRGFQDAKDAVCVNLKHVKMNLSNPELLAAVCSSFEEFRDEPRMAGLMALVDNPGDSLLDLLPRLREAGRSTILNIVVTFYIMTCPASHFQPRCQCWRHQQSSASSPCAGLATRRP